MTHPIDDDMLQAYLDRELGEGEALRVAAAVEQDEALALRLTTLRLLGAAVREAEEERAGQISQGAADALFAAIERRIQAEPRVRVPEAEPPRDKPALRGILGGRGARITVGTTGFLALAAAVALMVRPPEVNLPKVPQAVVATQLSAPPLVPRGSQILNVEFGSHTGTHFSLEGESGEPIAVVWIQEEPNEARQ